MKKKNNFTLRPYAQLMRLDKPIGTWLLLLPCLWGVALAGDFLHNLRLVFIFAIGAIIMRGAGCVVNDMCDRDFDRRVARTKSRPLASGSVTMMQAGGLLIILLALGLIILLQFNFMTIGMGLLSLPLIFTYPLMKRITWWPQLFLGLTFNWGVLMGWVAMGREFALAPLLLYVGGIFWTLAYDTIYAHQDKGDDAVIGVKSLALFLGGKSQIWIAGFFALAIILMGVSAYAVGKGMVFYAILFLAMIHAFWQIFTWDMDDAKNCLARFRSNRDFGLIILAAFLCG